MDPDYKDYKGREVQLKAIYIPSKIAKEFVTEFHKRTTQRHNETTVLVKKLEKEYIIHKVHTFAK